MKEHEFEYFTRRLDVLELALTSIVGQLGANFVPLSGVTSGMLSTFVEERMGIEHQLVLAQLREDRYVDGSPVIVTDWLGQNQELLRDYLNDSIACNGCRLGGVGIEQVKVHGTLYRRYGGTYSGEDVLTLSFQRGQLEVCRERHGGRVVSLIEVSGNKQRKVIGEVCVTEGELLTALKDLYQTVGVTWPTRRTQVDVELLFAESKLAEYHVIHGQDPFPKIELAAGPWRLSYAVNFGTVRLYYGDREVSWDELKVGDTDAVYQRVKEGLDKQYSEITA